MKFQATHDALSVRAIAGPHVVILAIDVAEAEWDSVTSGLLGFAIERTEMRDGEVLERYWLRGMKRFEGKDERAPPGSLFPLSEHPLQSFQWGDYTAKPEHHYWYRIVPVYGKPKFLELREGSAVEVEAKTPGPRTGDHAVFFSRGVAGSQAYVRKFSDPRPDPGNPCPATMTRVR